MRWLMVGFVLFAVATFSSVQLGQVPEVLKPYIGKPVPDAVMVDVDGKKFKISDFKSKVLLLNFWTPH